ncbi:8190_t:CDS:2, partial [Gigaspora rosea]
MLRKCIRSNISGCIQREKDLQPHESYILQNTASHALLGTINDEEDISNSDSLQKNLSDRDQHINNYCSTNSEDCSSDSDSFQENFSYRNQLKFMASNMLSSSNQLTNTEEVELEIEDAKEFRQTIVDSGIDFQVLPGEYGPYFKNIIEMLFFTSQLKYENLVCIIQYPNFQPEHNMKTPSTSRPFKNTYTISVSKHIKRVLSNRTLYSQMYFGPRIGAETKSEFWHRNIWQESPLFSQSSIQINQ